MMQSAAGARSGLLDFPHFASASACSQGHSSLPGPCMTESTATPSESLGRLYAAHHGWLQSWLRLKLGDAGDVADVAQDTFVRVLQHRHEISGWRQPRAYLSTIARGLVVDLFRRRALEQAYLDALAAQPEPVEISPEARAEIFETLLAIDAMLDRLGPRTREIFLMAQIEGLSYVEIGQRLRVSVTTIKKHLVRALVHCAQLAAA